MQDRKHLFPHKLLTDILCLSGLGAVYWELVALNSKRGAKHLAVVENNVENSMEIWGDWVAVQWWAGMLNDAEY